MDDSFSDSDGEKAVEELLSQAMDSTILEQVAAINCAGFSDSGLPSQLETRFQRLKSFPSSTTPKPASLSTKSFNLSHPPDSSDERYVGKGRGIVPPTRPTKSPEEKLCSSDIGEGFSPFKENRRGKMEKNGRGKSPTSSFSSYSSEGFSGRSVSPPVKSGCFLCSPKKVSSKKKNKENKGLDLGFDWGKKDELLSNLSNFSVNSQKKMKKKAVEEEERICREADKIVKWAKQASARMVVSGIENEISDDDENAKFH
ncbi:hypothetical protein OROHE_009370 [Orobanche hederae]